MIVRPTRHRSITGWPDSVTEYTQITRFMGSTWGPPGSCRPQMGPTAYPMECAHSSVVLCLAGSFYRFSEDSCHALIHIIHGCFTDTEQSYDCSNARELTMVDIGLTGWYRTLTKTRRANRMHNSEDGIYIEWVFGHFGNKLAFSEHNNKESDQD